MASEQISEKDKALLGQIKEQIANYLKAKSSELGSMCDVTAAAKFKFRTEDNSIIGIEIKVMSPESLDELED